MESDKEQAEKQTNNDLIANTKTNKVLNLKLVIM